MYEAVLERELRQGDVIAGVYFPRYSFQNNLALLHKLDDAGQAQFDERAVMRAEYSPAVVISQCCEFNPGKRNLFSLARLTSVRSIVVSGFSAWGVNLARLVPAAWTRLAVETLRRANQIDEERPENEAVNVYLYDADGQFLTEPHVVDFTQVFSIKMQDSGRILASKVLQLDNEHRQEFQLKLGYFYTRPAE